MGVEEKILLVQLILEDIRGNWKTDPVDRVEMAESLCKELIVYDDRFKNLKEEIRDYIISSERCGDWDGRYFREAFPYGYEGMDKLHSLNKTYHDKSYEFKRLASDFLIYPEYRFEDWE